MMTIFIICACEAIGDITATCDGKQIPTSLPPIFPSRPATLSTLLTITPPVSQLEVDGEVFDSRIQGGILADGLNGMLATLMTITPMSTFAQNNGVIALTRCANRKAGYCCW